MNSYNLVVIGGGPGGYVAAIRAANLGLSVALVEKDELGGTCLNRGCIPSKTLLHHAEVIEQIKNASSWGIETGVVSVSIEKIMKRKDQVIKRLRTGIAALLKAGKITHYHGQGTVTEDQRILVENKNGNLVLHAEKIILATGSTPFIPSIPGIDQVNIHTSDTIFNIKEIPNSLVIIGGGIIGVEIASIFASLDVKVTIIEMADRLVPNEDVDAIQLLHKELQKKGIQILTSSSVTELQQEGLRKYVKIVNGDKKVTVLNCDEVLVAVGRKPNFTGIHQLDLALNGPFVAVNDYLETSIPNVYAIGDLIGGWQLAHVASAEGLIAASNAAGHSEIVNYKVIPRCIYTNPEVASVGMTEREAKEKGLDIKIQTYQFVGNGKALTMDEKVGFVKVIAERKYGEILGVVMAGPHVTEMISESAAFIHLEGTMDELGKLIHPHPSLSEALFETAEAWLDQGIHVINK